MTLSLVALFARERVKLQESCGTEMVSFRNSFLAVKLNFYRSKYELPVLPAVMPLKLVYHRTFCLNFILLFINLVMNRSSPKYPILPPNAQIYKKTLPAHGFTQLNTTSSYPTPPNTQIWFLF